MSSSNSEHQTKREYQQLLRLHERLLSDFQGAREELSAPGTDGLVKVIKARTGSSPELAPVKTAVEEAIRALYAKDAERFTALSRNWPSGIRDHALALAAPAFA